MEAEALLPISLATEKTVVVMAGDPKQLGPTTFSKVRPPTYSCECPNQIPYVHVSTLDLHCPRVHSCPVQVDSVHGLHCSVMERLQGLPAYANDRAGRISTYLSKNYRSHPALVRRSKLT